VLRGGAWKFSAESCSSAYRYNENPGYADVCFGYDIYGFRCIRNAAGPVYNSKLKTQNSL
jgi:formylglycine-generating enzyme required for sulfatase activity